MDNTKIFASSKNFIEDEALVQIKQAAAWDGVLRVVGLPDLHPGKGGPVGAAMITEGIIYPYFIGNDIGCGMRFSILNRDRKKMNAHKWAGRLLELNDNSSEGNSPDDEYHFKSGVNKSPEIPVFGDYPGFMGTIGKGNHFAEFSIVESIEDKTLFDNFNLSKNGIYLLVHSGSRGHGNRILRAFTDANKNRGAESTSRYFAHYMKGHNDALIWAKENRKQIAGKILDLLGATENFLWDSFHNFIESMKLEDGRDVFVHRKGAVAAGTNPVVIPGSRGSLSYLVLPLSSGYHHAFSLAHGAGRKWNRIKARQKAKMRYKDEDIRRIKGHAIQVSRDRDALYEEVPEAYKNIDTVIHDLVDAGLVKVIATFAPQLTYKGNL